MAQLEEASALNNAGGRLGLSCSKLKKCFQKAFTLKLGPSPDNIMSALNIYLYPLHVEQVLRLLDVGVH